MKESGQGEDETGVNIKAIKWWKKGKLMTCQQVIGDLGYSGSGRMYNNVVALACGDKFKRGNMVKNKPD